MNEMQKRRMTCEEFETAGLDLGIAPGDNTRGQEALAHLRECARCAALHENWQLLREDLHAIGAETRSEAVPSRVELRLRQEFRTQHKTLKLRRAAIITSWGLAAAAALLVTLSLASWRNTRNHDARTNIVNTASTANGQINPVDSQNPANAASIGGEETLVAANDSGEFTLLPGDVPGTLEDGTVVQVRMQRGALGALGLAVNEERAGDWIQVDLLVGEDGQPEAVRLPQTNN